MELGEHARYTPTRESELERGPGAEPRMLERGGSWEKEMEDAEAWQPECEEPVYTGELITLPEAKQSRTGRKS